MCFLGTLFSTPMTWLSWYRSSLLATSSTRWASALLAAVLALPGCGPKQTGGPGAQDPEKQAIAEHDVAADALQKGNLRTALVHAKKAVELDDSNPQVQLMAATVYLAFCAYSPEECKASEAEKHAREALKLKKDFGAARNTLGVSLVHQRRFDDAITVLRPLTEDMVYATPELAWGNLGWAYLEKGDADQAIVSLKRAVALQPDFCLGNHRLGLAYEKKGDLPSAKKALSAALETNYPQCQSFPEALETRARVLGRLGDASGARADLERCVKSGGGTPTGKRCSAALGQPVQ